MFDIGTGKVEMTFFQKGAGMLGYGMYFNTAESVHLPLFARAYVIREAEGERFVVIVNAEIAFITIALKVALMRKLNNLMPNIGFTEQNVMLCASHTHSAIGGYSHYVLYNITTPGFIPESLETYSSSLAQAVISAWNNLEPGRIFISSGKFDEDVDIAFNRSVEAYNANPEVTQKISFEERHKAVDRKMTLLRFESADGRPMGMINWFAVHPTSLSNDNHAVSSDNKGFASQYFEQALHERGHSDFVAAFLPGNCGDITPNYIWDKKKKWTRGKYEDDMKNAEYNGRLQFDKALEIYDTGIEEQEVKGELDWVFSFADISKIRVSSEFTNGLEKQYTSPSVNGVAFLEGTVEGPGMPKLVGYAAKMMLLFIRSYYKVLAMLSPISGRRKILRRYRSQTKKWMILETGDKKLLGTSNIKKLILPSFIDRTISDLKRLDKEGYLQKHPWAPNVLPIQIFKIGDLAICGIPMEITTIAGKRLKKTIHNELIKNGVSKTMLLPYSNAYNGYITTYEEYQLQKYEGGHTPFGQWTLAGYQTRFKELAMSLSKNKSQRNFEWTTKPPVFESEDIWKGFRV